MKKTIVLRSLLLLLSLVLALAAFASCDTGSDGGDTTADSGTAEVTTGGSEGNSDTERIAVSGAVVLTPSVVDKRTGEAAEILVAAVKEYTGVDITLKTDEELENNDVYEILIGATNRTASSGVLSELNGQSGFVVKKVGKKIVINATAETMLDDAVNYFVNNYVSGGSDGSFTVAKDLLFTYGSTGGVTVSLSAEEALNYKLVFSQELDIVGSADDPYSGADYICQYLDKAEKAIGDVFGITVEGEKDTSEAVNESLEVLLGRTNRPETKAFLRTLKVNEYGYAVIGNKLVIAGWGDLTSARAIELFIKDCESYVVEENGEKKLVLPDGEEKIETYTKWKIDIPMFRGGSLEYVVDMVENAYHLYYENTSEAAYLEYRKELEEAGYELYQENRIGDNLYATYHDSKMIVHAYYLARENTVRVAVSSKLMSELPVNVDDSPNYGPKVIDHLSFTMHDFDGTVGNWGNAFIMTLEDGSFIFHDGGANDSSYESEEIWDFLNENNMREDGRIVIAAYILSHGHKDHHDAFDSMMSKHRSEITLERIIHSEAGATQIYPFYKNGHYATNGLTTLAAQTGAPIHKAHMGQTFQIRNLKFEVIMAPENCYPNPCGSYNSTSLVTRFFYGEGENEQTLMIIGDTEPHSADRMVEIFREDLKCDIVQVGHHGWGGSVDFYAYCKPSVVVWPGTYSTVNSYMKPTNNNKWAIIDRSLVNQENVVLLVVADDGHKTLMLPLIGLSDDEEANEALVIVTPRLDGRDS